MSKGTLGFIGIGMMGLPMSGRLVEAGYDVVAYDIRPEAVENGNAQRDTHRPGWL